MQRAAWSASSTAVLLERLSLHPDGHIEKGNDPLFRVIQTAHPLGFGARSGKLEPTVELHQNSSSRVTKIQVK